MQPGDRRFAQGPAMWVSYTTAKTPATETTRTEPSLRMWQSAAKSTAHLSKTGEFDVNHDWAPAKWRA